MESFIKKIYTNGGLDLFDMEKTGDGHYIAIGMTDSKGVIFKFDSEGNILWTKKLDHPEATYILLKNIKPVFPEDVAFVIQGTIKFSGSIRSYPIFLRISTAGDIVWSKVLYLELSNGRGGLREAAQPSVGPFFYFSCFVSNNLVIGKISSTGNLLMLKQLETSANMISTFNLDLSGIGPVVYGGNHVINLKRNASQDVTLASSYSIVTENGGYLADFSGILIMGGWKFLFGYNRSQHKHCLLPFLGDDHIFHYGNFTQLDAVFYETGVDSGSGVGILRHTVPNDNAIYLHYSDVIDSNLGAGFRTFLLKLSIEDGEVIYNPAWRKGLNLDHFITDMIAPYWQDEKIFIASTILPPSAGLIGKTNSQYEACVTETAPDIDFNISPVYKEALNVNLSNLEYPETVDLNLEVEELQFEIEQICPTPVFTPQDPHLLQSPYLHLQAAGSVGQDSTAGIHLRWMLLRNLGDTHLPKGNYADTDANFNKQDDFVYLYRIPYTPAARVLNLQGPPPDNINHIQRRWTYLIPNSDIEVDLFFHNAFQYQVALNSVNPNLSPFSFIQAYGPNVIEATFTGALIFAFDFEINSLNQHSLQVEAFSTEAHSADADLYLSARKVFTSSATSRIVAENMRSIRYRIVNGTVKAIRFERYMDFLGQAIEDDSLEILGQFALTREDDTAFERLEDASRGIYLDEQWLRYNGGQKVRTANYKQKWVDPDPDPANRQNRIRYGVEKYIALSNNPNNPTAIDTLFADTDPNQGPELAYPDMEGSFLDMLSLISMDYHIARMLGLGYIDTPPGNAQTAYIYLAEYHTLGELDDGGGARSVQHLSLSLPTRRIDQRRPERIRINELRYGLVAQENGNTPIPITDEDGYLPNGAARYIRLYASQLHNYEQSNNFFQPSFIFNSSEFTYPVFAGIEYRKAGDSGWRHPEIAHDQYYQSQDGTPETLPLPFYDGENRPVLIHREEEEGIHQYAPYAINIFSRASNLGNPVSTNYTQFTKPNTLLPPADFRVQLIQPENPLLLTTQMEQDRLEDINGTDKTLVRVTFNYTHVHDQNYDFGNQVELFFRAEMPPTAAGRAMEIIETGNSATVKSAPYIYSSIQGQEDVPTIPAAQRPAFLGGYLSIGEEHFEIEDIHYDNTTEDAPNIIVKKREERDIIIQENGQPFITQVFVAPPTPNGEPLRFTMAANMHAADSWGTPNPLTTVVNIGSDQWETRIDTINGQEVSLRGIWADASCINPVPNDEEGVYIFSFDSFQLDEHPQEQVEWFGGVLRVPLDNSERIELEVIKITQDSDALTLYAQMPSGSNELEFPENTSLLVNFYPGYRVYLYAQGHLTEDNILPDFDQGYKNSLMGARSKDTSNSYTSDIGTPAILMAQEIVAPVVPDTPAGPTFATPPDQYNKSTFTFNTWFSATPFQLVFYRADRKGILHKLYEGQSLEEAYEKLASTDKWAVDRWHGLLSFNYPGGQFAEIPSGSGIRLPLPNKAPFTGSMINDTIAEQVKETVYAAFTPVTPKPLLYREEVENTPRISPLAPAKKIEENGSAVKVRFTDFTLDGSMITSYFYYVRTLNNTMKMSVPSGIIGPIRLINTQPPESPIVRKVTTQLADAVNEIETAVRFEVAGFPHYENIHKVNIYRSLDGAKALSVRTMKLCKTVELTDSQLQENTITILDDFQDNGEIPFGQPLFYRLAALRTITYPDPLSPDAPPEDWITEYVPSLPTKVLLTNVVDTINPPPPEINASYQEAGDELQQVVLTWSKSAFNAHYYLFKMNSSGNWNKIFEVKSNDPGHLVFSLPNSLPKKDEEDNTIYHRFKVTVENSSGLLNQEESVLTI